MLSASEIVQTLAPINGAFFSIPDLPLYAHKVLQRGKALVLRCNGELLAYLLYYDDQPVVFVSMIWTAPERRRAGFASTLLRKLIDSVGSRAVELCVKEGNPALAFYERMNFQPVVAVEGTVRMALVRANSDPTCS